MAVTANSFRQHFVAFADRAAYPDTVIEYWAAVAVKLNDPDRWGDLIDNAVELYTAHNLVLEARALKEAEAGGIPGQSSGIVNSKSVDKVSVGYDTSAAIEDKAGHWNLTTYGARYFRLANLIGVGPVHLGAGEVPIYSESAWAGVMY